MSDAKSYAASLEIGDVILGGTVSRVEESQHPEFSVGEWVLSFNGWQDYFVSDGAGITSLGDEPANPSYALGITGYARVYWLHGFAGYR